MVELTLGTLLYRPARVILHIKILIPFQNKLLLRNVNNAHLTQCFAPVEWGDYFCETVCKFLRRLAVSQLDARFLAQGITNTCNFNTMYRIAMTQFCSVAVLNHF